MKRYVLKGWGSKNLKPEWVYNDTVGFVLSVHKNRDVAYEAVTTDLAKITVTVEVDDE